MMGEGCGRVISLAMVRCTHCDCEGKGFALHLLRRTMDQVAPPRPPITIS